MTTSRQYSPEVWERAVRLVREYRGEHPSRWAASPSIAGKIGCTAEALRHWVRQAERDAGQWPGLAPEVTVAGNAHELLGRIVAIGDDQIWVESRAASTVVLTCSPETGPDVISEPDTPQLETVE